MSTPFRRFAVYGVAVLFAGASLTACGANDADDDNSEGGGGDGAVIALLLPETATTRYEEFDKPLFEAKVADLCPDCTVNYYNADQNEETQAQQVDTAITEGADVLVLDPVNGPGATGMVQEAQDSGAEVIAYDRFIENADYYMSFDNETVGELQAQGLLDAMGGEGSILMLNGAPSDPNAAQFKAGAHSVLDGSNVEILKEYDNPDWSPENAQKWTTDQLAKYDASEIDGVYAANDGQAGGVVLALTGAGVAAGDLPPITGQDAELAAVQRIVAGEQTLTVFKSYVTEAEKAAEVAVALATGEEVTGTTDFEGVASFIFDPVVVTQDNVQVVIDDGLFTVDEICTAEYADACGEVGLQ